jgi:hypothetical protein
MEEGSVPPPPPPTTEESPKRGRGFHLPRSGFFKGFRRQIASYELPPDFREGLEPVLAGIGAFILSAFFTLFISLGQVSVFSPIFSGDNRWIGSIFLAPPVEETVKGLSVVALMLFVPRAFPNRRYAAAIGAAAGLGYTLSEDITYFGNPWVTAGSVADCGVEPRFLERLPVCRRSSPGVLGHTPFAFHHRLAMHYYPARLPRWTLQLRQLL